MTVGDYVRYTAEMLRGGSVERHEVLKLARYIGRVEYVSTVLAEVSWPGTRRPNDLISPSLLEVVQVGGRHAMPVSDGKVKT